MAKVTITASFVRIVDGEGSRLARKGETVDIADTKEVKRLTDLKAVESAKADEKPAS